jgi:copper(I)-binding protein
MKTVLGIALALILGWGHLAQAAEPSVRVADAWARATGPNTPVGMAFITLTNGANQADRLVSASTPAAAKVEFHRHVHADGAMKMQLQDGIDLPPGATIRFSPGGLHVMLDGLKARLAAGQSVPLTLTFAKSAPVTIPVVVVAQGAPPPGATSQAPAMPSAPAMQGDHAHDPAMHEQHMKDPAYRSMHEQHMQDPDHRAMHERMHGKAK